MADERVDSVVLIHESTEHVADRKTKGLQWSLWDLIALTSVIAIALGMPIPAIVIALPVSVLAVTVLIPVLIIYIPVLRNRKRLNSDNVFISLITKTLLLALITISLSSASLWIKVQTAADQTQAWQQVMEALNRYQ